MTSFWFKVRMKIDGEVYEDEIKGSDWHRAEINARWNWPTATDIEVLA